MSIEQSEILEGIKGKIQSVKVMLLEQKDRNRELSEQNDALLKEVQQKQSEIKELEERNQKLSLVMKPGLKLTELCGRLTNVLLF